MSRKQIRKSKQFSIFCLAVFFIVCFSAFCRGATLDGSRDVFAERKRLIQVFESDSRKAVPALKEALDEDSAFLRRTAAHLLVRTGKPALEGIEKALEHSDFQVRRIAIRGLAEMEFLSPYWEQVVSDDHPAIRHEARQVLALKVNISRVEEFLEGRSVLFFSGEDTSIHPESSVALGTGDFSCELWFNPFAMDEGHQGLMGKGRGDSTLRPGVNLRYNTGGIIDFRAATEKGALRLTHRAAAKDKWMHVAAVIDRKGKAQLFLNGEPVAEACAAGLGDDASLDAGSFVVGRRPHSGIWHFNGAITELRVWRTARSREQIRENMIRDLTGEEEDLLLYWPMNEGKGEILHDRSKSLNHGQIRGKGYWK